jgi:hypothetical protein
LTPPRGDPSDLVRWLLRMVALLVLLAAVVAIAIIIIQSV